MNEIGKALVVLGLAIVVVGGVVMFADKIPWMGKLPGDIILSKPGYRLYLPITTCLILSLLITFILKLFSK